MNIPEAIINRYYETKFGETCFGVKVKDGDLTDDEKAALKAALKAAWRLGTPLSFGQIEKFQSEEQPLPKKEWSAYQEFKRICEEYSGPEYYNCLKDHLGIQHLSDLEKQHSKSMVEDLLKCQIEYITSKTIHSPNPTENVSQIISSLTHKDNAYNLWKKLFEGLNR